MAVASLPMRHSEPIEGLIEQYSNVLPVAAAPRRHEALVTVAIHLSEMICGLRCV